MKKWVVNIKKNFIAGDRLNPERFGYEVSVIHVGNAHGFASYGCGGDEKIIVGAKDCNEYAAPFMLEEFIRLAEKIAADLNKQGVDFV